MTKINFLLTSVAPARIDKGKVSADKGSQYGPPVDGDRITTNQLPDKRHATRLEDRHHVRLHEVEVLFAEFARLVFYGARIVAHDESRFALLWRFVIVIFLVNRVEFLQKRLVGCTRETGKKKKTKQFKYEKKHQMVSLNTQKKNKDILALIV